MILSLYKRMKAQSFRNLTKIHGQDLETCFWLFVWSSFHHIYVFLKAWATDSYIVSPGNMVEVQLAS